MAKYKSAEEWFEKNGYNKNRVTYIYFPEDSFDVKEELKDAGFKFDKTLLWHIAEVPAGYEDKVVDYWFDALGIMTAWNEGVYGPDAKEKVMKKIKERRPQPENPSEWVGEVKEKITKVMTVTLKKGISTRYGLTNLIKFVDDDNNIYQWWSNCAGAEALEKDDKVTISATVKSHDEYMGDKITTLTRCKVI